MTDIDRRLSQLVPDIPPPPPVHAIRQRVGRRRQRRLAGALAALAVVAAATVSLAQVFVNDDAPVATEEPTPEPVEVEVSATALSELATGWDSGVERMSIGLNHGLWLDARVSRGDLCIASRYGEQAREFPEHSGTPQISEGRICSSAVGGSRMMSVVVGTGYGPVNTSIIGAAAPGDGEVVLRFPSGQEQAVDLIPVPRWPGLAVFGVNITWDDESAPQLVLVGSDGRDIEVRRGGPVARAGRDERGQPVDYIIEYPADAIELGSLPDGEYLAQFSGYVDTAGVAALRLAPGDVLFGEEAEAAHAGDETVEHTGIYFPEEWDPPTWIAVDPGTARFQVFDARWDPPQVEVDWDELVALLRGEHVFPLYWSGLVEITIDAGQITSFSVFYTP